MTDASNNPLSGVTVTFGAPGGGASATFAGGVNTAVTDGTGVATSPVVTANLVAGTYGIAATAAANVSTSFTLTNQPGPPATVTPISGSGQNANINSAFANPFVVQVTDAGGNPLRSVTVTFFPPSSGASGVFAGSNTAITDNQGFATSGQFSANGTVGSYTVSAVAAPATPASFSLSNINTGCTGTCGTITVSSATIGKDLQSPISISLAPAPPATGVVITVASSDATKALVGNSGVAGTGSLTASLSEGQGAVTTFVQALASSGTATITVSAPGYTSATATITFAPSGFVISGPMGSVALSPLSRDRAHL